MAYMNKLTMIESDLNKVIDAQHLFDFPNFLLMLRRALCVSRKCMAEDMDIPYLKIFFLESGGFHRIPHDKLIRALAEYFGVSTQLMRDKATDYTQERML